MFVFVVDNGNRWMTMSEDLDRCATFRIESGGVQFFHIHACNDGCLEVDTGYVVASPCIDTDSENNNHRWELWSVKTGEPMVHLALPGLKGWKAIQIESLCLQSKGAALSPDQCTNDGIPKWNRFGDWIINGKKPDHCLVMVGTRVTTELCKAAKSQSFIIASEGGKFSIKHGKQCLSYGSSPISLAHCDNKDHQQWMLRSFDNDVIMMNFVSEKLWMIQDKTGLCLKGKNSELSVFELTTSDCADVDASKTYRFGDCIVNAATDHCLTPNETSLKVSSCDGGKHQDFAITIGKDFWLEIQQDEN